MPPKGSNALIIADKAYSIDWPTVNMHDAGGFNAHTLGCATGFEGAGTCGPGGVPRAAAKGLEGKMQRYRARHITGNERSLRAAQAVIKQFVIHLDGCANAGMCFDVLHNERGLSCHFVLDNDGTIYQTLDLIDCAYHACGLNETSIGIEMCNRGNAAKEPNYYDRFPKELQREQVVCYINNEKYVAFDFTPQQYAAMEVLGKAIAKLLPGIKLDYPHAPSGEQSWATIDPTDLTSVRLRESYSGYIGHYHITNQKWDPGPFDFKRYLGKMAGKRAFPIGLHKYADKTEIPDPPQEAAKTDAYQKLFEDYYANNEYDPDRAGGYFPVGPLEMSQLWHGGIHLHADEGDKVVAPLPGEIVVARNGPGSATVGSTSFVLIKHTPSVGGHPLTFFTLLYHLKEEKAGKKGDRLKWMAGEDWDEAEPGHVVVFKTPVHVQPGDVVGHVGQAGPDFKPQIHWEIFAPSHEPISKLDKHGFWHVISGTADQRICTNKEILDQIDKKPKDGIISHSELVDAFTGDPADHEWTRHVVASHYSEWADYPDWELALKNSPELAKKGKAGEREAGTLFHEQIEPGIWLHDDVAIKLGLAAKAPVYCYHPISFLKFLNEVMTVKDTGGLKKATKDDYKGASLTGKTDFDDKEGKSFIALEDYTPPAKNLELPDMVEGYPD
jgi:N-acetyl-anhydromuramyl-L-alanine amidase AmpD/murein DD-endopeptidase MepM/ murein hydrolase activator NlpD